MKGDNEFHFNEATMIEALNEYLRTRIVGETINVTSVECNSNAYARTFIVKIESPEKQS